VRLENEFAIDAPADAVWEAMLDFGRVAECIPGAQVIGPTDDGGIEADIRVKVGPMAMAYRGRVAIVEQDVEARRAVMRAEGRERRGQGTVAATMDMTIAAGRPVVVSIATDLDVTGRVAQMGRGVMQDVAARIMDDFASNLREAIAVTTADPQPAEPVVAADPRPPRAAASSSAGAISVRRMLLAAIRGRLRALRNRLARSR
jgi:carbon monoxide dehydrogenase subunit G